MAQDREQGNAYRPSSEHISEVTVIYHSPKYNLNIFRKRMPGVCLLNELINFAVLFVNEKSFASSSSPAHPVPPPLLRYVCLSVPLEQIGSDWRIFMKLLFFNDFSNKCLIQNFTRMRGNLLLDLCTFTITNSLYSFRNHKLFRKKFVEKIKTQISVQ
jgi:hypothetical protein